MIFGDIPVDEAEGAILAHATVAGGVRLKKGHVLNADDILHLRGAGVANVAAARLDATDIDENAAASRIAEALWMDGVRVGPASTGRVNFFAVESGLFTVDPAVINGINAVDPSITIATLKNYDRVHAGQMVATVKVIPFAVRISVLEQVIGCLSHRRSLGVHAYRGHSVGLVQTELPSVKPSVLDKTRRILDARVVQNDGVLSGEIRVPHRLPELAKAIQKTAATSDIVIIFGASAVVDPGDIVPQAIRDAGGRVHHVGMPVDPGNLLVLGELGGKPVIGAPGCARSPKENGFDWVLDRLMAGIAVEPPDIIGMGVGGLLMEIPTRPQPRDATRGAKPVSVAIALLAAGKSSRMGGSNKLLARFEDQPLIRRSAERAIAAGGNPVIAVLGHMADQMEKALDGLSVMQVRNAAYATGISSSIKVALQHVPLAAGGLMVHLADMPALGSHDLKQLIETFERTGGRSIVRATFGGKRGNPVIFPRGLFSEIERLTGDVGARHLIETGDTPVVDVELGAAAAIDVDTPETMRAAGGLIEPEQA
ncbi:MAG: NTP transferase domain-containing protein [Phyllobacterium sp.]